MMTKEQMYERVMASLTHPEEIEFIKHELELLKKRKASKSAKAVARKEADAVVQEAIFDFMEPGVKMTVKEMRERVPELADLSPQKVVVLVGRLIEAGLVERTYEKRKAYFARVVEEA